MKLRMFLGVLLIWYRLILPGQSQSEGVHQLMDMNADESVLRLDEDEFRDFIKASPRNYSVIVMFTALEPERECYTCRRAYDEFKFVANSIHNSQAYSDKLFFVLVDFDECPNIFQVLQLNTAPIFMHFPPKGNPEQGDTMDIENVGFTAEAIAKWIGERTHFQLRVFRLRNYLGTVTQILLFGLVTAFLYLKRNNLHFLFNKNCWAIIAIFFCLAMVSGQVWNHMEGPHFKEDSGEGITFIYGLHHEQLVLETYMIAGLNAGIVLGMILMAEAACHKGDVRKRSILSIAGLVLVITCFSLILSIAGSRDESYPYRLLFK